MMDRSTFKQMLLAFGIMILIVLLSLPLIHVWETQGDENKYKYFDTGITAYRRGDYQIAERSFQTLISIYPDDSASHYYLGLCLLEEGKTGEARAEFKTSLGYSGTKMGRKMCGEESCEDSNEKILKWMDSNPNWQPQPPRTPETPMLPSSPQSPYTLNMNPTGAHADQ
jgi:tetratricopeptide (TPR) repeat protein